MGEWKGWKNWAHVTYVKSRSEPGKRHELKRRADGLIGCGCLGYRFSTDNMCPHIEGFLNGLSVAAALDATAASERTVTVKLNKKGKSPLTETYTYTRRAISFTGDLS